MKTINVTDDVVIPPSIFIFHNINSLYFIYKEHNNLPNNYTLKSILKSSTLNSKAKKTVRIQDSMTEVMKLKKHPYTRKK
jgi:hypothetical protein